MSSRSSGPKRSRHKQAFYTTERLHALSEVEHEKRWKAQDAAEHQRQFAEQVRLSSEEDRIDSEKTRDWAEARRVSSEAIRIQAEQLRQAAEEARKAAELLREAFLEQSEVMREVRETIDKFDSAASEYYQQVKRLKRRQMFYWKRRFLKAG